MSEGVGNGTCNRGGNRIVTNNQRLWTYSTRATVDMRHNEETHTNYNLSNGRLCVSGCEVQYRVTMNHVFRRAVGRSGSVVVRSVRAPQKNGGSVVFGGSVGTTRRQSASRTIQSIPAKVSSQDCKTPTTRIGHSIEISSIWANAGLQPNLTVSRERVPTGAESQGSKV